MGNYGIITTFLEYNCDRSLNTDNLSLLSNIPAGLTMYYEKGIENEEDCSDPLLVKNWYHGKYYVITYSLCLIPYMKFCDVHIFFIWKTKWKLGRVGGWGGWMLGL